MPKGANPIDGHPEPKTELKVCIFCGMPGGWRRDSKRRVYFACSYCRSRVFLHSHQAVVGMEILHRMVVQSGVQRHRRLNLEMSRRRLERIGV